MKIALVGAVAIAAISTLGDFIWATWISQPRAFFGLIHGALLFLAIGMFLGWVAGRPAAGAIAGAIAGAAAAASFYLIAPMLRFSAMFVSWFVVWLALAFVYAWLTRTKAGGGTVFVRGIIAALGSGCAFYLISGIWRPFDPQGWDYATHFAAWTFAYFPGFAALLAGRKG